MLALAQMSEFEAATAELEARGYSTAQLAASGTSLKLAQMSEFEAPTSQLEAQGYSTAQLASTSGKSLERALLLETAAMQT